MGGNRTPAGLASRPRSKREPCHSATIPVLPRRSRRFRRKVRGSNPRTTMRHALAERCLTTRPTFQTRTRYHIRGRSRRDARLGRSGPNVGYQERGEQEHELARPVDHPQLEQPEPSAAATMACAGNNRSVAVGIANIFMTNTSIRREYTGPIESVKNISRSFFEVIAARPASDRVATGWLEEPPASALSRPGAPPTPFAPVGRLCG